MLLRNEEDIFHFFTYCRKTGAASRFSAAFLRQSNNPHKATGVSNNTPRYRPFSCTILKPYHMQNNYLRGGETYVELRSFVFFPSQYVSPHFASFHSFFPHVFGASLFSMCFSTFLSAFPQVIPYIFPTFLQLKRPIRGPEMVDA